MPQRAGGETVFAVIPAAGRSERMGRPKLALPLGDRTVLERVIDALRSADVVPLVVLAPHVADLAEPARAAGALVLELPAATSHMRETIERGLDHLQTRFALSSDEAWLLVPADHPTLDGAIVRRLRDELARRPDCSLALPTFEGRRGHPTLIRWQHADGIREFDPESGLNRYLRQFPDETLSVDVPSPDVLLDLDTPEDYAQLCAKFAKDARRNGFPT